MELRAVGVVRSPTVDRAAAPRQGDEGAPRTTIEFVPGVAAALAGLAAGAEVLVLTWLHLADRDVLTTYPRDDRSAGRHGVFATRSPDRPNPIGLHRVRIVAVDDLVMTVDDLEAVDGTPVLDVKPVLTRER